MSPATILKCPYCSEKFSLDDIYKSKPKNDHTKNGYKHAAVEGNSMAFDQKGVCHLPYRCMNEANGGKQFWMSSNGDFRPEWKK